MLSLSESDLLLLFGIIPVTRYGNCGYCIFQFFPFFSCKREIQRAQVLFQMRKFCRTRNGDNSRCLLQKPSQRQLRRCHATFPSEALKYIYNTIVGTHCFRSKTRKSLSVIIGRIEFGIFIQIAPRKPRFIGL